jgi:hypothetical protein
MKVAIRGYIGRVRQFEDRIEVDPEDLDKLMPGLAEKHAKVLAASPHMIEIEFLDEPDINERFFRFGTDPTGMVMPIPLDLDDPKDDA